jgi:hypothetical protein
MTSIIPSIVYILDVLEQVARKHGNEQSSDSISSTEDQDAHVKKHGWLAGLADDAHIGEALGQRGGGGAQKDALSGTAGPERGLHLISCSVGSIRRSPALLKNHRIFTVIGIPPLWLRLLHHLRIIHHQLTTVVSCLCDARAPSPSCFPT